MELNETKFGFTLKNVRDVKDFGVKLYEYEHAYSGGHVAFLECDDTNCSFGIAFRTLPKDSTGVCHIIEHSTLCGSGKFPLKEPFVNLLKSSLNTFLNAFTAYDWTAYPFASQCERDFNNILEIYCDAVFNPRSISDIKPFLQEGWHYELNSKDDVPLYKGVVYNEMKGAMSSVDNCLTQATLEAMYKDTDYRHNSGGDPDVIPELTYDAYKKFYKDHYTPENSIAFFYGKMDIDSKLEFLDREYYSKYKATGNIEQIVAQEPFINTNFEKEYELGPGEEEKDNTYFSLCYGLDNYKNYEHLLAMTILCDVLFATNQSPAKKALLDAGLGQDVDASIDDDNIVPALHVYLHKSNLECKEKFKETFESEVKKLVDEGIDKASLLAAINNSEFKMKEMDMGRMPKGLVFTLNLVGSFLYNQDLMDHLEFSKIFKKFKAELNNGYFENILKKYILESTHNVEVTLKPSTTLSAEKAKAMEEKMKNFKASLSEDEINDLVNQTKDLIAFQNRSDTPEELATLPQLELSDIPLDVNFAPSVETSINGLRAIEHKINTNKIAYLRMYFDLSSLTYEELAYLSLMGASYFDNPTSEHSVTELVNLRKTYLGDLSFQVSTSATELNQAKVYLSVSVSSLLENVSYMSKIVNEVIYKTEFKEENMKLSITQGINGLKQAIIGGGMGVAMSEARAAYSDLAAYNVQIGGSVTRYRFLENLLKDFDLNKILPIFDGLVEKIFRKDNVLVSISGDDETLSALRNEVSNFKLNDETYPSVLAPVFAKKGKKAVTIPGGVSYNAVASNLNVLCSEYSPSSFVLSHIALYDFLWNEVRVKGGAYGSNISIFRNGDVAFGSYRDPNVKNTFETYAKLSEYLRNFNPSSIEFKNYIIGAMGGFDAPGSTPSLITSTDASIIRNVTKEERIELKKKIIATTVDDVKNFASLFDKVFDDCNYYTIGNEDKIKEYDFEIVENL